jgi:hypothetical protein
MGTIALDSFLASLSEIRELLRDNRLSKDDRLAIRAQLESIVLILERHNKPSDVSVH